MTLTWSKNPDANIAGYNIYYSVTAGLPTKKICAGLATSVTISNLTAGVTYYFAATTVSAAGLESCFSPAIAYTIPIIPSVTDPPTLDAIESVLLKPNVRRLKVRLTGITSGSSRQNQLLTITAVSSNHALIPDPKIIYISPKRTAVLLFSPVAGATGVATITVTVNAGVTNNNLMTRCFNVTVKPPSQNKINLNSVSITPMQKNLSAVNYTAIVTAVPASLAITYRISGQVAITVTGTRGQLYAVQASTNFMDWVALQTNASPFIIIDTGANNFDRRFYRAVTSP